MCISICCCYCNTFLHVIGAAEQKIIAVQVRSNVPCRMTTCSLTVMKNTRRASITPDRGRYIYGQHATDICKCRYVRYVRPSRNLLLLRCLHVPFAFFFGRYA